MVRESESSLGRAQPLCRRRALAARRRNFAALEDYSQLVKAAKESQCHAAEPLASSHFSLTHNCGSPIPRQISERTPLSGVVLCEHLASLHFSAHESPAERTHSRGTHGGYSNCTPRTPEGPAVWLVPGA